jgi:hypothetical protein
MSTHLGLARNAELSFAGSVHFVRVFLRFPSTLTGACQGCLNQERVAKKISVEVVEIQTKDKRKAGYHVSKSLAPEAKKVFRDGAHLCFECIGQLPCRA